MEAIEELILCMRVKEERIVVDIPGKKFSRQSIAATECGEEIIASFGYEGACNSELFLW
jgi:hypothetical protein